MSLRLFPALCCSLFSLTCSPVIAQEAELTPEQAQAEQEAFMNQFSWVTSGTGEISSFAKIEIPEGFRFLNGKETADVMEAFGNLPSKYDGMIGIDLFFYCAFRNSHYQCYRYDKIQYHDHLCYRRSRRRVGLYGCEFIFQ